jgi:hypothetical protein
MVSSERIILPFAQTAKFCFWIITYFAGLVQDEYLRYMYYSQGVDVHPIFPVTFLYIGIVELMVGILAFFPKAYSWLSVLTCVIYITLIGLPNIPWLFTQNLLLKPTILSISIIGAISLVQLFVLADKRVRDRYCIGYYRDPDEEGDIK